MLYLDHPITFSIKLIKIDTNMRFKIQKDLREYGVMFQTY